MQLLGKWEKWFLGLLAQGGGGRGGGEDKNSTFFVCTEVSKKVLLGKRPCKGIVNCKTKCKLSRDTVINYTGAPEVRGVLAGISALRLGTQHPARAEFLTFSYKGIKPPFFCWPHTFTTFSSEHGSDKDGELGRRLGSTVAARGCSEEGAPRGVRV